MCLQGQNILPVFLQVVKSRASALTLQHQAHHKNRKLGVHNFRSP